MNITSLCNPVCQCTNNAHHGNISLQKWPQQGGHWSGKSQGKLIFLQGQGKVREFYKLVREILNTKKVRQKSGNFIILAQNMCCSRYFDYLKCEKSFDILKALIFSFACFARSKLWKLVNFRKFCAKKLFKDFICFICRIREVHFSELVKGICHLSAARVFWSVKNWIWSVKSLGFLFLHEGGHPAQVCCT